MHDLLGKKQIILASLVVALGLAVFVNWYFTGTDTEMFPEGSVGENEKTPAGADLGDAELVGNMEGNEYFASVRLTRDAAHASALEELQAVVANAGEDSDAVKSSAEAIENLSGLMKMETDIESIVTGKTGSECVAVISDNTVEVIVPSDTLSDSNVLTISDAVNDVCEGKFENIKISGAVS